MLSFLKKQNRLPLVALCGIFVLLFIPGVIWAQEIPGTTQAGQFLGYLMLNVASGVTWLGGMLLEKSIKELILGIGTLLGNNSPLGTMVTLMWGVVRDVCNLLFIFGFIYIGIRTIIDADDSNAKRMVASIIISALLINFSLFFAKVVIDASNYTAVAIYNTVFTGPSTASLSAKFADTMGILKFYDKVPDANLLGSLTKAGSVAFYFMASLMLIVAGFVFAAGAMLIVTRFVALVFIMVFSPLMFAATVFPQTASYASLLWKNLFNYSFFAPAYLFLMLISVKIIGATMTMLAPDKDISKALMKGEGDAFTVILVFIVGIMFLITSLKLAQQFGIKGADTAMAVGNNLRGHGQKLLGGATVGMAARTGRATFGWLGNKAAESDYLKDAAARKGPGGVAARLALRSGRVAADSSFDARKIGGVGAKMGIGEGRTGGYKSVKEEVAKKESEFAKSLGEIEDTDIHVEARKNEWKAAEKKEKAEVRALRREQQEAATSADRRLELQGQIDKLEKDTKEAQIKYESEKQRRIIGSTYAKPNSEDKFLMNSQKALITGEKKKLKDAWDSYVKLTDDNLKEDARKDIQKIKDSLEDLEKEHYKVLNRQSDRGYAGKLEASSDVLNPLSWRFPTTWPRGRQVHHERAAGKEIRKTAEKGLPKKKDD